MLGLGPALALVTVLTLSSAQAGLIETNREQPPEVRATWNRSGSAVCPDGYDYVARIRRCVARTVTAGASLHSGIVAALLFARKATPIKPGTRPVYRNRAEPLP